MSGRCCAPSPQHSAPSSSRRSGRSSRTPRTPTAGSAADAASGPRSSELGDPDALAARYTDTTRFLIGPHLYPEWERLLRLLLPIVVPIAGIAVGAVGWVSGKPVGEAIVSGLGVAFTVAVQLTFWFTLVFAIAERTGSPVHR